MRYWPGRPGGPGKNWSSRRARIKRQSGTTQVNQAAVELVEELVCVVVNEHAWIWYGSFGQRVVCSESLLGRSEMGCLDRLRDRL